MSREWRVLELCAREVSSNTINNELSDLLSDVTLDWAEIMHQALRHNLLPVVAYNMIVKNELDKIPCEFHEILFHSLENNKHFLKIGYGELGKIVKLFEQEQINYVVTKGFAFDSTIYKGVFVRKMNDLDMVSYNRIKRRGRRISSHESLEQLNLARNYYVQSKENYNFIFIDGDQDIKKVQQLVRNYMK